MPFLILQITFICTVFWVLGKALRRFFARVHLRNIPGPPSHSFLKGNFSQLFNVNAWNFNKELAENYGRVVKLSGLISDAQLYVFDTLAMHHILVKDQHLYEETSSFIEGNRLFFGDGLLSTIGAQHRKQRKMVAPVFSTAHMRTLVPIFVNVAHKLENAIASKIANGPQEVDMLRWISRTALELIGQSGLGHSFDPLADELDVHPYSISVKRFMPVLFQVHFIRTYFLSTLVKIGTPRFRRFVVDILPFYKNIRRLRDMIDIMHNTSVEIFESKKKAIARGDDAVWRQASAGKDLMSILMKANMDASEEDRLLDSEVLAQMSTFTFAAMDTTSGALSRILHLLATHPDAQEKLRQELHGACQEVGDLTYDELVSLPFLDAVCRETLRLYPPVSTVMRTTRRDVVLPFSVPVKGVDGREMHEITIPNDTNVIISIFNANRDPALWGPDSYEWKPERWLSPLPEALLNAHVPGIYSHLMTFLGGGRACIGFKFSQLEMKVVLAVLVQKFRFLPSEKEIFWLMSSIAQPTVKGLPGLPQLPLQVSKV